MPELEISSRPIPQEMEPPLVLNSDQLAVHDVRRAAQIHPQFPPVLNSEQLAVLLDRALSTVLGDVSRAPHKLPPWSSPPGSTRKVWLTTTVLSWLKANEMAPAPAPAVAPTHEEQPKKSKAGHPGNKKIAEARVAGFPTYAAWQRSLRAQKGGAQ